MRASLAWAEWHSVRRIPSRPTFSIPKSPRRYALALILALASAAAEQPGDPLRALQLAASGSCDAARADLAQQFASNSNRELQRLAGLALVQCNLAQGRMAEIFPLLDELRKAFPGDADVLYETAKVHMKAWNDAVLAMYKETPASYRVNQLSGEIFETQGRYAEAATEYRKAIQKNPAALNLHFRLGRALLLESHDAANLREARKEFEAELALNPSDAAAEYEIGQTYQAEQNAGAAATHFEKAVALDPNFAEALVALAKTKSDAKQHASAIPLLERAIKLQPTSESAHYSLMLAYRNAGRMADAQREKEIFDKLSRPPEGEFTEFLKKLGEKPKQ
ncbi:MAG TPA: tetratricopeptide repeat protein [Bryobacteraceae bacterium]|nr:tetratricopeptide repeat protein [Bryobacteraceae bacterium]